MDIIDKIDLMIGEEGEGGPATTTSDVAKVPIGTKKSYRKKKKDEEELDEEFTKDDEDEDEDPKKEYDFSKGEKGKFDDKEERRRDAKRALFGSRR